MKKIHLLSYITIGIMVIAMAIAIIFVLGSISETILDKTNDYYQVMYINGERGFSAPWYEKGLHRVDEAFINTLNEGVKERKTIAKNDINNAHTVFLIGSSVSSNAIDKETANNNYKTLVCGNGCYRSNRLLINLAELENIIKPDDIIKYEISFSTFRDTSYTITESVIDKWGKYRIKDDLTVIKNNALLAPIYAINIQLIKIQNVWELAMSFKEQKGHPDRYPEPIGIGNFKNNYFDYDAVAESCHFDDTYAKYVKEDIDYLNSKYDTIVEFGPLPTGLLETDYGKILDGFIDEDLIPYLTENNICYRDVRYDFTDSEFTDGVHLSYEATKKYTRGLDEFIGAR